ncbi:M20/M25/M40 family metallo-hydrolase, partial [Paenibacillus sp. UNC451MF]|uniref:M20/M25/M40 family metallo-hydrolase n=1 Tax=Paenibacillus sp. UNC451MF TaxID=1449063 RepID=UPI000560E96F
MRKLENELLELLAITAPSGMERPVADFLMQRLKGQVDSLDQDDYGNVLAEKQYGIGAGPTILLCAHMDTVWVDPKRCIVREEDRWSSNSGPLGADDRAGIAIILDVLRKVQRFGSFHGRLKLAFTREEEIGRIGSGQIDPAWLQDIELAMVIDRRGSRDIVVRNSRMRFCNPQWGVFFEAVGMRCGMSDWRAVQGGISDAVTFASYGIPSVNLSAGYEYEHSEEEYVNVAHCRDTVRLLVQALQCMFYRNAKGGAS